MPSETGHQQLIRGRQENGTRKPTRAPDLLACQRLGGRVVVVSRLQQRAWTAEDGSARSTVEVIADELGQASVGDGDHD
jgi:hypothetical protein